MIYFETKMYFEGLNIVRALKFLSRILTRLNSRSGVCGLFSLYQELNINELLLFNKSFSNLDQQIGLFVFSFHCWPLESFGILFLIDLILNHDGVILQ